MDNLAYDVMQALNRCKYVYDSTVAEAVAYVCHCQQIKLTDNQRQAIIEQVKAGLKLACVSS